VVHFYWFALAWPGAWLLTDQVLAGDYFAWDSCAGDNHRMNSFGLSLVPFIIGIVSFFRRQITYRMAANHRWPRDHFSGPS